MHAHIWQYSYTEVFWLLVQNFMGMCEVNLEPWQAEALDQAVFKLSTLPSKSEG